MMGSGLSPPCVGHSCRCRWAARSRHGCMRSCWSRGLCSALMSTSVRQHHLTASCAIACTPHHSTARSGAGVVHWKASKLERCA